ncbi:MAG: COQ9 family protein [Hyphomonadaceae bacterium]
MATAAEHDPTEAPSDRYRARLLDALLPLVPELGWTETAMRRAAEAAGLSLGEVQLAAPGGVGDMLDELGARAAREAGRRMSRPDVAGMKIREKVTAGVLAYLAALAPYKAALKRASGSPFNLLAGPKAMWSAADRIWAGLGDTSNDFNWYTKRMTLSAVLGSTLLCWLGTDDDAEVETFLTHRIENVMQFEKTKKQVQDAFEKMPNPLDFLGRKPGG